MSTKLRFFLAPLEICGLYANYTATLRALGHKAEFFDLSNPTYTKWDRRQSSWPIRFAVGVYWFSRRAQTGNFLKRGLAARLYQLTSLILMIWVAIFFDVVVLKSGETITGRAFEVWLYKRLGVRIIAIFHGSDSRPPYLMPISHHEAVEDLYRRTLATRARVDAVRAFADIVVDNPSSAHNQTGRCCIYQVIGNAVDHSLMIPAGARGQSGALAPLRIVHAPSSPELKGSGIIRSALRNLQAEGHNFEYIEITGRPHAEVINLLCTADIVIDELYSDMHGAVFALEACACGCPVVVGGYDIGFLDRFVPSEARLPSYHVHPNRIQDAIGDLLANAGLRQSLSERAYDFAQNYGSALNVGRRLVQLAEGNAPAEWYFDPSDITYVYGTSGSAEAIRSSVRALIQNYGEAGLMMDDKAALKQALLDFAAAE